MLDLAFSRKEGEKKQKTFTPHIAGIKGIFFRLRTAKTTFSNYYKMMFFNVIMGIVAIGIAFYRNDIAVRYLFMLLGILWVITPAIMCKISLIPHRASNTIKEEDKKREIETGRGNLWGKYTKKSTNQKQKQQ